MDKKVEVINKFGQTLAIFTSEDEETIDRMIDPVVTLTQNSDNVFSFSISEKSQKWEDIKSIENLYIVDGHVYSPLFEDSYTHIKTEDGENLIQVRAYERQKMLEKTFVTAWNSETGFADIDAFMVVILSKGNLPLKNGNKATGVEVIVDPGEYSLGSAGYIMKGLLYGTGWDVGIADVEGYFDFETEQLSVYENLLKVQEMYGGILIFDSMNKLVHLRQESNYISYTGYEVRYKKNLKDMELAIDNKIVTRLYVFGEAGLNIASVNDDKIYLENYTYSNEIFEGIESNTDIYEPDQLKAWGERKLLDLCAPRKVLTTNIAYLTQKEGFEQEKLKLNDSVRVYYDEAEFVAPEAGVEIVATEIEAEGVKSKKENYITLKGNTNQDTVEGEDGNEVIDTDIAITDANVEKENYITLQGNTSQEKFVSPNLLQITAPETQEYNGVTVTNNGDGTITLNGTSTNFFELYLPSLDGTTHLLEIKKNTNYFLNGCIAGGNPSTYCLTMDLGSNYVQDIGSGVQFNSHDSQDVLVYLEIYRNQTFNNAIFKPMLIEGTEAIPFEPYGKVVPSPDYPGEVKVVAGENIVKISDGTIIPDEYQQVEYITSSGTQYIRTGFAANQDTSVEMKASTTTTSQNAAFYCSRNTMNGAGAYVCFRINNKFRHDYDTQRTENLSSIATNTIYKVYSNKNKLYVNDNLIHTANYTTFQSPYNMILLASHNGGETASLGNYWSGNLYYCKIWDNETLVRDFVPCYRKSDNAIGLYDRVEGIFYTNAGTGSFTKGPNVVTEYKVDLNSSLISMNPSAWEQGSISAQNGSNMDNNTRLRTKDYYPITAGTYYLKIQDNNYVWTNIEYYNESKNFLYAQGDVKSITGLQESAITITSQNVKYLRAVIKHSNNTSVMLPEYIETIKPTIQEGNSYIDPIELCETEDHKDKIHKNLANGKWYVHKEINKVALNGGENWSAYEDGYANQKRTRTSFNLKPYAVESRNKCISTHFSYSNGWNNDKIGSCFIGQNTGYFWVYPTQSTLSDFKAWLASSNVVVRYPLQTPIEIEITSPTLIAQLEALYTAELAGSTTYISTVADDLEPFIDLKYNVVTQVPSPQKPSEVQVVTGENKFEIVGKQLYNYKDTSTVTTGFVTDDEGWISYTYDNSTGTTTRFANYWTHDLNLKPSQKYALFVEVKNVSGNAYFSFNSTQGTNGQVTGGGGRSFTEMTNNSIYRAEITARESHTGNIGLRSFITYSAGRAGSITFRISVIEDLTISKEDFKYEPYQKTSYTVNFGDLELCNINNYQDYTFKNSIENPHYNPNLELNAWYKYCKIVKKIFDGSESWVLSSLGAGRFYLEISPIFKMISGTARGIKPYSSHFVGKDNSLDFENGKVVLMTSSYGGITHYFTRFENDNTPTLSEWKTWLSNNNVKLYYVLATPTYEKITDLALTTQLEALYKATLVSPYSHIYSDTEFPIIDLRYNVITPSLYIESSSDLLRVTGVDYPVFNPSSATLTLGDVTLNTNNIFKKISNTTNAYNAGLIPAGSVKITESDGTARPITQEFEVQHSQNATFEYGIGSLKSQVDDVRTLVDENGDDIKDLEEHVDTFEQTAYGLINTLKNRSGNNLLRNSSACFGNEFWTGLVKKEATLDEVHKNFFAKSCFNLQNGTLGQQIAVPNGEYYVGFKYKKLIELANCSIDINGTIVELTSMDYETSDNFIQVNDYSITIKLISDTDDACYVGDIMIVAGNKEKWSPNPNEIYYDSVEIGKGIQVNSNTANTYTRIDADGNRIYNRNSDEIVTELTEYGLSTERVECKEIKGAGILIQEVQDKYGDNQTWITKI